MTSKHFFSFYPLIPVCLAFIIGIIAGERMKGNATDWLYGLYAIGAFAVLTIATYRQLILRTLSLLLTVGAFGLTLTLYTYNKLSVVLPNEKEVYEAVIISEPIEREKNVRFDMALLTGPLTGHRVRAFMQKDTVTSRHEYIRVGTGLVVRSRINAPKNFDDSNFDYIRYLNIDGIVAQTYIYANQWYSDTVSLKPLSHFERSRITALRSRHDLLKQISNTGIDGETYSLASAMLLGDRTKISSKIEDAYSTAGISHILSLSGLHLSIIYALLCFIWHGKAKQFLRELILLLAIWTYVFIAGAEPPLLRSALMITIYTIISVSGRNPLSLNVLAFTALIMLVLNPLYIYDVGFQLSFFSIGSIMILYKPITRLFNNTIIERKWFLKWIWHCMAISLAAQIGTAPLIALYFGHLPVYFLLSNIIAVPLTTGILYLSVFLLASSFIPAISSIVAFILSILVAALNTSMNFIASLPCASITGITINSTQVLWIYFTIVCLCLFIRRVYKTTYQKSYDFLS